jgi:uncharacterized membrane protein YphA (DoxX/SURF4 family)
MSTKYRMAAGVAPMFLRVALAVVFIWAGMAKLRGMTSVDGETAAVLANMGVITPPAPASGANPGAPSKPLPPSSTPAGEQKSPPDSKPAEEPKAPASGGHVEAGTSGARIVTVAQQGGGATQPAGNGGAGGTTYTAADFPEKVPVKNVYMVALMIHNAAHPKATPENPTPRAYWPAALASGRWPVIQAWLVMAAELGGGVLAGIGLCTRLAGFSLAVVMAGAMWLAQIGPAVASGHTVLGFLPDLPRYDPAWTYLLFPFVLFAAAVALMFSGAGYMAADHLLFGGGSRHEDHDGE